MVQATPSSQAVPSLLLVVAQPPLPSHTLVAWHWVGVQAQMVVVVVVLVVVVLVVVVLVVTGGSSLTTSATKVSTLDSMAEASPFVAQPPRLSAFVKAAVNFSSAFERQPESTEDDP